MKTKGGKESKGKGQGNIMSGEAREMTLRRI